MYDAYKVLGLGPDASNSDIKRAYRKLAMEYHPDRNQSAEAQKKIKEVNEAYSTLNDPTRKREHDARLHMGNRTSNFNPNSFFDQFFDSGPLRGFEDFFGHTTREQSARNFNEYAASHTLIKSETIVTLEEVNVGARRRVHLNGNDYDISIPRGIRHGETVRVFLDDTFELHMLVKLAPHSVFTRRDGIDIHTRVDVPLSAAVGGGEVRVPILGGEISLTIPKGTSSHTKLRASGAGLFGGNSTGNAYYEVRIKVPRIYDGSEIVIQQLLENQSDE